MSIDKSATMDRFKKLFDEIGKIKQEGGPRHEELKRKMRASIEKGERELEASERALAKLRGMSEEDWWEDCYQKGILGSGATNEWLTRRKAQDNV